MEDLFAANPRNLKLPTTGPALLRFARRPLTIGNLLPTWKQASALNAGAIGYVFDDPGNAIQRWDRRHACLNYSLLLFNWTPKRGH